MNRPLVSIVIPTRDGARTLPAMFAAIGAQKTDFDFEIIAVDSGSRDGSLTILNDAADTLLSIEPGSFDHGTTRNLAVERARGDFVVLMVQDAVPADDAWLSALVAPLRADRSVAGTFARQLPNPGSTAIAQYYLRRWRAAAEEPRTVAMTEAEYARLDPAARLDRCAFDNVCSCIRREVWLAHPFRPTTIAEDLAWAKEVLLAGYRLAYVPAARVLHSHDRSATYELARTRALHRRLYELFGLRTIPTVPLLARATASSIVAHMRCEPTARSMALAFAWPLGQYLGARAAVSGRSGVEATGV